MAEADGSVTRLSPGVRRNYRTDYRAALAYSHQSGVIPCDIKPLNRLLDRQGVLRIVDFVLAKPEEGTYGSLGVDPTFTSSFFGTVAYTAPDQLNN